MAKVCVDKNVCIGCGYCFTNLPNVFYQDDDYKAKANENISDDLKEEVNDISEGCPVGAIKVED